MTELTLFQEEVRDFLSDRLTPELRHFGEAYPGFVSPRPIEAEWRRILNEKGWSVPGWSVEYGGTEWSAEQIMLLKREMTLANAPRLQPTGENLVGPVIIEFGTAAQKSAFLPPIRTSETWWAQGYSEPNAGSDLASLQTKAERDGDDYIINGTKIWTSHAHKCEKIFCLVRTSNAGKPQAGISFLLFDLDTPGIEVRPIITFGGEHEFNQVFFTDVRVPVASLLGKENEGWNVSKFLLTSERAYSYATVTHDYLNKIRGFARQVRGRNNGALVNDPTFSKKLAKAEMDLQSLDLMEAKALQLMKTDMPASSILASANKVQGTKLQQAVTELAIEMLEHYAIPLQPRLEQPGGLEQLIGEPSTLTALAVSQYFNDRAMTIAGGTTEIQKNIIAARGLGL